MIVSTTLIACSRTNESKETPYCVQNKVFSVKFHLTWEKVPPPGGGGVSGEISVKSRFESKFSVKSPVYFWVENLGQNAI